MTTAVARAAAKEFFRDIKTATGSEWEAVLLQNARNVSTPLAKRMLSQMGLGPDTTTTPIKFFENACGIGVAAPLLQGIIKPDVLKQSTILCGDFSEPVVEMAKQRIQNEGWLSTEAEVVDAQKTGLPDGAFTHVATNIGFHVVPDSQAALNESIRILQPGGVLGFTTWHTEVGWMTDVKEAFASFPFAAPCDFPLQITPWGRWSDVNWIRKTLVGKGLVDVKVDVFAFLSPVDGVDAFLSNFAMMIDLIIKGSWSEELRREHPREEVRALMKKWMEEKYGDEGWEYSWVAVVASGRVPAL